jgi:hypothetical protein
MRSVPTRSWLSLLASPWAKATNPPRMAIGQLPDYRRYEGTTPRNSNSSTIWALNTDIRDIPASPDIGLIWPDGPGFAIPSRVDTELSEEDARKVTWWPGQNPQPYDRAVATEQGVRR